MNIKEFKEQVQDHLDAIENLIGQMPQKGNTTSECQRMTLQQSLNELGYALNGTTSEDLVDIETVTDQGELVDEYPVDEAYISNAGDAEVYLLNGTKFVVITYNDRAEEHEDGEQTLTAIEDED